MLGGHDCNVGEEAGVIWLPLQRCLHDWACQSNSKLPGNPNFHIPRAQTLVVIRTFSLPSRNRWMMEARCSTVSSPLSKDTWWPSCIISTVSHLAFRRVYERNKSSGQNGLATPVMILGCRVKAAEKFYFLPPSVFQEALERGRTFADWKCKLCSLNPGKLWPSLPQTDDSKANTHCQSSLHEPFD